MKTLVLSFLVVMGLILCGQAQVVSDFETGTPDGWTSEGDGIYYWESGTGNPGGCMRVDDDATGNMNRAFAPLKFLGNWSLAGATDTLKADIFLHKIATTYVTSNFVFRIAGPGGQATAILSPTPASDVWTHYKVSLSSTDWQLNSGTWNGLMQNVTTLIVTMEYISGDEYNRLDNVSLSFTPVLQPVVPVICSGFEEGGFDGWYFQGTGSVSNQSSGGSPGHYIQVSNGSATGYAFAPTKFLGVWTSLDNHAAEICFDLLVTTTGALQANDAFLRISGPGGIAKIAMTAGLQAAFGQWHTFAYPIQASAWTMESGTWSALLEQVSELRICLEFSASAETVGLDDFCLSNIPPVADFSADYTYTFVGNPVQFTDLSDKVPTSWSWNFGDGSVSAVQNPSHTYLQPGTYPVSLTATNYFGSDTETKTGYITVAGPTGCDLFSDNFSLASLQPAWTTINGTWGISSGTLRQTSNYYGTPINDGCYAITGGVLWDNYVIAADLESTDDDQIGLVFRFQDTQNMYMFMWTLQTPFRALYKWVGGVGTILASDSVGYAKNTWYHVELGGYGGNIGLRIDGQLILTATDNTWASGKPGLYCRGNQNSLYDNVVVECAIWDTVAPGNVTIGSGQSECYEATNVLTTGGDGAAFVVQPGGSALLVAGQSIRMLPSTLAVAGGYLHAWISGETYCPFPPADQGFITQMAGDNSPVARGGNLTLHPNPATGLFYVDMPAGEGFGMTILEIFDVTGERVLSRKWLAGATVAADLNGRPSGLYLVRVTRDSRIFTGKIILTP